MNISPITIEVLSVIDAIDSRGSYAAAAEQLNKVPSALSYLVQKLEEQLNVTLFERQGRRSVLTPAGKHLLAEGRKLLNAVNVLSEQTQTIANGWEPRIKIAADSVMDISTVFKGINLFLLEHQNIEIDVQEEVMNGTWEALVEDRVDLVIGAPAPVPNQKGIRSIKIESVSWVLVAGKNHELVKLKQPISRMQLSGLRTVIVHDSVEQEIARSVNVIQDSQHFFVDSIGHKIEAIKAGVGVGFLPKKLVDKHNQTAELVILSETEVTPQQDIFIAWKITNKGKGLQRLKTILVEHFNE